MTRDFKPGDHLKVRQWRRGLVPYYHHGIYINDDRVIQFGQNNAGKSGFEAVALGDFEREGLAEVVQHGRTTLTSGYLFESDEPWKIVARAEFLLKHQPQMPYHVIGHNCETIANMCAVGLYPESHQVRTMFMVHAVLTLAVYLAAQKLPAPKKLVFSIGISSLVGPACVVIYNQQIRKFWAEIKEPWLAHERFLAASPPESGR